MATTIPHHVPTLQHAIADLTGYEDADTLCWSQAGVQAAPQLTVENGRDAGTDTDRLAHGLALAPHGAAPLLPPDTAPPMPDTSLQEGPVAAGPEATAASQARARRTRPVRAPRGQTPAPTGSPASWPTSEAPASMNVKLKVGNMELMYTARDTNDRDLQDRMTTLLPWLAEVMAACEQRDAQRKQAAEPVAEQPTLTPPLAPPERTLDEQMAATVQAALQAPGAASTNGQSQPHPAPQETPARDPEAARHDNDPRWCARHQVTMTWHNGNERGPGWFSHRLADGSYCKGK